MSDGASTPEETSGTTPPVPPVEPPRPAASHAFNFAGAVLLSGLLGINLWIAKDPNQYVTYGLGFGVLFLLGVPVNRLLTFFLKDR